MECCVSPGSPHCCVSPGSPHCCVVLKTAAEGASSQTQGEASSQGQGVFANVDIAEGYRFGPFEGEEKVKEEETSSTDDRTQSNCSLEVENSKRQDGSAAECSWMKLVKHASSDDLPNLDVLLTGGEVYFVTCRPVKAGEELLLCDETLDKERAEESVADTYNNEPNRLSKRSKIYSCSQCKKTFKSKDSLREHKRSHQSASSGFQCELCQKTFKSRHHLSKHEGVHKSYTCQECERVFKYYKLFLKHQKDHENGLVKEKGKEKKIPPKPDEKTTFTCDKCGKTFHRETFFVRHVKREHEDMKEYKCSDCHKVFKKKKHFTQHVKVHVEVSKLTCPQCQKVFSSANYLRRHQRLHSGIKPHKCDVCQKAFREWSDCLRHKRIHTNDRKYKCDQCDKAFTAASGLKAHSYIHLKTDPDNPRPFKCNLCVKGFKSPLLRDAHVRRHVKKTKRQLEYKGPIYECEPCQQIFRRCCQFTRHKAIHSGEKAEKCLHCDKIFTPPEEKPYNCEQCGKGFLHKSSLSLHILVHLGEKNFECQVCKKKFVSAINLRAHERHHVDETAKKHKCNFCEKTFFRLSALTMHMFKHTGERPHKCPQCGKAFYQRIVLEKHLRIHNGIKPFKCEQCGKCFTQKSTLVSHIRVHTGQKPYKCDLCNKTFRQSGALGIHMRSHAAKENNAKEKVLPSTGQEKSTEIQATSTTSGALPVVEESSPTLAESLPLQNEYFTKEKTPLCTGQENIAQIPASTMSNALPIRGESPPHREEPLPLNKELVPAGGVAVSAQISSSSIDCRVPDYVILTPVMGSNPSLFANPTSGEKSGVDLLENVSHLIEIQTSTQDLASV